MSRAIALLQPLREDLPPQDIAALRRAVRAHYDHLVTAQRKHEFVPVDLAALLCERLDGLLAAVPGLDADSRAAVVGAARYFVSPADAVQDEKCTGLDDDVEVFNHVASSIGRDDLLITE